MPTPYAAPIGRFLYRIEEDRSYFHYYNLSEEEAMGLAVTRAKNYLQSACDRIMLECQPDIDFSDRDDVLEQFNDTLVSKEIFLVVSLMYEYYLDGYIAKLKTYEANYTSTALRVFSPNEARTSFQGLYKDVCERNTGLLDMYNNTDRKTGAYKGIDYASLNYGEEA